MLHVLLAVAAAVSQLPPEPPEVLEIREAYERAWDDVDNGHLYMTEITINPDLLSYPALGNYCEYIVLYWQAEAGDRWLVLAVYDAEFAAHDEYAEILFSGGPGREEMIFYYFAQEGPYAEYRTWYSDGQAVYGTERYAPDEDPWYMDPADDYRGDPDLPGRIEALFRLL
jgi:hypothetical protein